MYDFINNYSTRTNNKINQSMFLSVFIEFCGADFENVPFYQSRIIFMWWIYCIFSKIRAVMKSYFEDAQGLIPFVLCNEMKWNAIVWISEWKQG